MDRTVTPRGLAVQSAESILRKNYQTLKAGVWLARGSPLQSTIVSASFQGLADNLVHEVLAYLKISAGLPPKLPQLDRLVAAYVQRVPWESASRIARRSELPEPARCVCWPDQFWTNALAMGTGGTCFESNLAFFSLLRYLGYEGYLTINNMGDSIGCHTAIVLQVDGSSWLVDAGFPLHVALPLIPNRPSWRNGPVHRYMVRPIGPGRFRIERDRHPLPYCFTLIDEPVSEGAYREATVADYGAGGFFLDRVIISQVTDDRIWRVDSGETPYRLESFHNGRCAGSALHDDVASALARRFGIAEAIIRTALRVVESEADLERSA